MAIRPHAPKPYDTNLMKSTMSKKFATTDDEPSAAVAANCQIHNEPIYGLTPSKADYWGFGESGPFVA